MDKTRTSGAAFEMPTTERWEFVAQSPTGILTTLRRDGTPVSLPVWFIVIDNVIYMQTRGAKVDRVRRDSRASFLVETGASWGTLRAVHFTGMAEVAAVSEEFGQQIKTTLDEKYSALRYDMTDSAAKAYDRMKVVVVRFVPDARVLSWDNRRLV